MDQNLLYFTAGIKYFISWKKHGQVWLLKLIIHPYNYIDFVTFNALMTKQSRVVGMMLDHDKVHYLFQHLHQKWNNLFYPASVLWLVDCYFISADLTHLRPQGDILNKNNICCTLYIKLVREKYKTIIIRDLWVNISHGLDRLTTSHRHLIG